MIKYRKHYYIYACILIYHLFDLFQICYHVDLFLCIARCKINYFSLYINSNIDNEENCFGKEKTKYTHFNNVDLFVLNARTLNKEYSFYIHLFLQIK